MANLDSEYGDAAKRLLEDTPKNPLDAIPYHERSEEGKPEADEATRAAITARLLDLPEESEGTEDEKPTPASGVLSLKSHYGEDGTLIVNLVTRRSKQDDAVRTTIHLKPDFNLGVFPDAGGPDPIPLSQPLAEALLEILPSQKATSPELYEKVSPEK